MTEQHHVDTYAGYATRPYRAYVLGALLVIYTFEVIDRILLALLQEQVRVDLHLSDLQLGILGGPAFVLLYVISTIPIARFAERFNRISIVAAGAALWSLATAACGLVNNFAQLFAARTAVGIGEAACVPPSHSVISDYFPSNKRTSAFAIFGLGIPLGTVLAAFGGGWMAQNLNWRATFLLLGLLGVAAAVITKLTVKDPPRSESHTPNFAEAMKLLGSKHSYWHATIAGALVSIFGFSITQFFVSYSVRQYHLELSEAAFAFGLIFGFAVAIGIFFGGFLCDRFSSRYPRIIAWLPALGLIVSVPLYLAAFWQPTFAAACGFFFFALMCHFSFHAPMFTLAQQVSEPRIRATAAALMMMVLTLVGYGIGPPLVGAIADTLNGRTLAAAGLALDACQTNPALEPCLALGGSGLRSGLCVALAFFAWAALHFWFAGRTYQKDRVD